MAGTVSVVQRNHCAIVERRTARKRRRCDAYPSCKWIEPGDVYLLHTCFPGHECNNGTRPYRMAECADCATPYRAHLLAPPSAEDGAA